MWEPEDEPFPEDGLERLELVFAGDIYSPFKLVTPNGLLPEHGRSSIITNDGEYSSSPWEHGVIIAAGEPVNKHTMEILQSAGIEDFIFPVRLTRLTREAL